MTGEMAESAGVKTQELLLNKDDGSDLDHAIANLTTGSVFNAARVVRGYSQTTGVVDLRLTMDSLAEHQKQISGGNLAHAENMLMNQAVASQSMFADLALRARDQTGLPQIQTLTGLALKAQSACRATLQALGELKYPRQTTFVKQANIAQGPQQVNNGTTAHPQENQIQQNKLLEADHGSTTLDAETTATTTRGYSALEAVEQINRPSKPRGKSGGVT